MIKIIKYCLIAQLILYCKLSFSVEKHTLITDQVQHIDVNYRYQDKQYQLTGTLEKGRYIFNKTGKTTLNLATLDWQPYVGRNLCNLGWSLQLAIAVLTAKDYRVQVNFYPWIRAVKMVESGAMEILYPEYFIEDSAASDIYPNRKRRELLVESNEMIGGNLSLFKHKESDFEFSGDLKEIQGKVVGVVRGYQNTPEFDALMDKGLIKVVEAVDDEQQVRLLLAKRVELIIGDPDVFQYVIRSLDASDDEKQYIQTHLEELEPAVKYNHLYFAVSTKYGKWQQLLEDINLSLIEFTTSGEADRIYQQGSHCASENDELSTRRH
ncbi:transporter substrate-binding domain-containing protein [Thalassotalea sp. G2M2-11]|uniref:substrate-binding periplasmic protein n=1 Tax=Thalassotalea sp. G2M2-11 TaxID=2787627 RepID=UPI0019D00A84|nr:transporter substrate-binding domain-containing protein [Thalassotalea sp. G2M2-11]